MNKKYIAVPDVVWQQFWGESTPMQEAYVRMETERTQSHYFSLRKTGGPQSLSQLVKELAAHKGETQENEEAVSLADGLKRLGQVIMDNDKKRGRDEYEAYRDMLRERFKVIVMSGDIIAVGFSEHRRPEECPKPVPSDLIEDGYFNWESGKIYTSNFTMTDIRFGYPDEVDDLWETYRQGMRPAKAEPDYWHQVQPADAVNMPKRSRPGRPSRDATILKAFEWGLANEKFDFSQAKSAIYEAVRLIVKTQYPDEYDEGKGLGVTPMRRVLSERIAANKLK